MNRRYILGVMALPLFLFACAGAVDVKPKNERVINVTCLQAGLDGRVRMAVPLTPEKLKKSGETKVLNSSSLYDLLLKTSKRNCTLSKDENLVGLASADGIEIQVLFNKRIATRQGVCDIPFKEANSIIRQLGLKFKHHAKGYDTF